MATTGDRYLAVDTAKGLSDFDPVPGLTGVSEGWRRHREHRQVEPPCPTRFAAR
jgi:hypothetical protein